MCHLCLICSQKAYIFTFLLSSRLFIEPRELLARVCHLCVEQLDKPVLDKVRAGQGALSVPALGRQPLGEAVIRVPGLLMRSPQGSLTCLNPSPRCGFPAPSGSP